MCGQVIKALKSSFLTWVPPMESATLRTTLRELKAQRLPFLAVVHMGEKSRQVVVKSLHHFKVRRCRMTECGPSKPASW